MVVDNHVAREPCHYANDRASDGVVILKRASEVINWQ